MSRLLRFRLLALLFALGMVTAAAAGCVTVRLVGAYDEKIDQAATQLQKQMDTHLTRLENLPAGDPGLGYAPNRQFYLDYGVELRALETRAAGLPKNAITVQQIDLMESNLESLRRTHETQNTLNAAAVQQYRELFNTAWRAILALELAKKRS